MFVSQLGDIEGLLFLDQQDWSKQTHIVTDSSLTVYI